MNEVNAEQLVEAYIAIRDERKKLLATYEQEDSLLEADLTKIETALLNICNEVGADSLKVKSGIAMRSVKERFFCSDWDNFYKFLLETNSPFLLERRIHQGNLKQFMTENKSDGLPPGLNVTREYTVTVRRASNSGTEK
mgnify:CR=1 FL=1